MGWKFRLCQPGQFMCEGSLDDVQEIDTLAANKNMPKGFVMNEALEIGIDILTHRKELRV